jgi:hypothetical protein
MTKEKPDPDLRLVKDEEAKADDEFDIERLRLDPATIDVVVKKPITVPVKKPPRHEFIRTHPDMHLVVGGLELKVEGSDDEFHIVEKNAEHFLGEELKLFDLTPFINRSGVLRLWPLRLPGPDGKEMDWHRSARVAAVEARTKWLRVTANKPLGAYEVWIAMNQPPPPTWPELTMKDMIRIAFHDRGRIIKDGEHPILKMLAGRL